jgi:predicted PurR-regulated permease PerM
MGLPDRPRPVDDPFRESLRVIWIYIRAQIVIAVVLTILYAVVFLIARVPFWPLIAFAGGVSSFITRVGSLVPLALAGIASLLGHRTLAEILIALGGWVLIQIAEGFYITPKILSKPLGLKALPVFLALLVGSIFFGPIGVLLAVPVLAVGLVFWRYFFNDRPL